LPYIAADIRPGGAEFGAVLEDAAEAYAPGESVRVLFSGAHPRNDTAEVLNRGYVFAERQVGAEQWEVVAQDWDPGLIFYWRPTPESPVSGQTLPGRQSQIEVIWHLPANLPAGQYRLRYAGTAVPALIEAAAGERLAFTGTRRVFGVAGEGADCPGYPAWF
jgi:neutral ceramidase